VSRQQRSGIAALPRRALRVLLLGGLLICVIAAMPTSDSRGIVVGLAVALLLVGGAVKAVVWGQRQQEAARRHHLARAHSLGELLALTPTEFEHATGAILSRSGFRLTRVGGPGDLGADLRGYDPHGRTVIVQCKRYAPGRKVSSRDLQSFLGVLVRHHQAQCGVYVTTADYTKNARDLARQHGIWLLDGNALVAMGHGVSGRPWV